MAPRFQWAHARAMVVRALLRVPSWVVVSVERYLSSQERIAAALELFADQAAEEEPTESATHVEGTAEDADEANTWYDQRGNPLMGPREDYGLGDDPDEAELVFLQRIPYAKKPN